MNLFQAIKSGNYIKYNHGHFNCTDLNQIKLYTLCTDFNVRNQEEVADYQGFLYVIVNVKLMELSSQYNLYII